MSMNATESSDWGVAVRFGERAIMPSHEEIGMRSWARGVKRPRTNRVNYCIISVAVEPYATDNTEVIHSAQMIMLRIIHVTYRYIGYTYTMD